MGGRASGSPDEMSLPELPRVALDKLPSTVQTAVKEGYDAVVAHPRDAAINGKLGMVLHAHNFLPEAEICYRRAHLLDPTSFRWIYYVALAQMDQAKCNDAVVAFRQSLQLDPDYLPAQLRSGECLLASANWEDAGKLYEPLVQKHPASAESHYGLGRVRAARNQWNEAVESFRKACELFPKFASAHFALARAYQRLGKADQAQEELRLSRASEGALPEIDDRLLADVQLLYRDYTAYLKLGMELGGEGKLDDAAAAYEEALQINPQLPEAETRLIYLYTRLGQTAKAEQHFRAAVRLDPKKSDAYFNYGALLQVQGRYKEAEDAFLKAVEINPRYAEAHNNLGYLFEGQGKLPEAITELRKAVELSPGFPQAHFSLGRILVKQGNYAEGIQHLLRSLTVQDEATKASYLYAVAVAYAGVGDLENSVRYLRLARSKTAVDSKLLQSIDADLRLLTGEDTAK
jgi:tetratricopeptide (TPR) repeat protein